METEQALYNARDLTFSLIRVMIASGSFLRSGI
jgi:hypothetical protein